MTEPAREGRVLALIEAEFRADDPGLMAMFDAFARRSRVPPAEPPVGWAHPTASATGWGRRTALPGDRAHRATQARRLFAVLLATLAAIVVVAALSGNWQTAGGVRGCAVPAVLGHPALPSVACPAARRSHSRAPAGARAPRPAHAGRPASSTDGAAAPVAHAYADVTGLGHRTAAAVEVWAARLGQTIRAQICQSVPVPGGIACQ